MVKALRSVWSTVLVVLVVAMLLVAGSVRADSSIRTSVNDDANVPGEPNPLSEADHEAAIKSGENFEFQAEVTRLMDIIINSLYSNREIFMRELISNAADALDKVRFLQLTNQSEPLADERLEIRIAFDKTAKTISITDTGVGMTKEDLVRNLGVIAKSGTSDFLEAATKNSGDALSLIGQFGVGFYSVYLVADRVTVISKHHAPESEQYIWESNAQRTFTVSKDPRGNTLGRGTQVILHMKSDSEEFINEHEIRKLVTRYSEFINYPILLHVSKMEERSKVEAEKAASESGDADAAASSAEGDVEVSEESDAERTEPIEPKISTDRVEVWKWERLNDVKAIWTRPAGEVDEAEYRSFYKSLTKEDDGFLDKIHFTAEGEITFRSIMYIPKKAPSGLYDKFYDKSTALKLYVRRVLISDSFDDFLPRYLNFIRGVVDSEDLPLNVSRETLAQSRVLKVMSKKLTRKVLEMLKRLSDANKKRRAESDDEDEAAADADGAEDKEEKKTSKEDDLYAQFWAQYAKSIKLGVMDDKANKAKLTKLLRYVSSKSEGEAISLDEYVDRMQESQKFIYYITGESIEAVSKSPFVEKLLKKDLEVLYMADPIDEYVMQQFTEYEGTQFMSVTKEGLKIDENEEQRLARYQEEFSVLTSWLQDTLTQDRVAKVAVSNRIAKSPMIIVTGQYGWSANMERIMSSQTFANKDASHLRSKKTLEINPLHPIVRELKTRVESDPDAADLKQAALLMYDACLLQSGFAMDNPEAFAQRVHRVVANELKVDPNAPLLEEEDLPPASESTSEEAESSSSSSEEEAVHEDL